MSQTAQRRKLTMKRFLSYRLPDVQQQNILSSETDISHRCSTDSPFAIGTGLILQNSPRRRDSFLYRNEVFNDSIGKLTCEQTESGFQQNHSTDEVFVTPYAQVIASLKRIRTVFCLLSKQTSQISTESENPAEEIDGLQDHLTLSDSIQSMQNKKIISETLNELDWVLEMLDQIQSQRSVSSLTNLKFKRLVNLGLAKPPDFFDGQKRSSSDLDKQLHGDSDESNEDFCFKGNSCHHQISAYINQFLDPNDDELGLSSYQLPLSANPSSGKPPVQEIHADDEEGNLDSLKDLSMTPVGKSMCDSDEKVQGLPVSQQIFSVLQLNEAIRGQDLNERVMLSKGGAERKNIAEEDITEAEKEFGVDTKALQLDAQKLNQILTENINTWQFQIFDFESTTSGRTLSIMGYRIFKERNLLGKFGIPAKMLINCLNKVENLYRSENFYHNSTHAADVMQAAHVLLSAKSLEQVYSDLEVLSTLFACAVHDVDHPGLTNQFLVRTENALALLYNDISVLENHHLSVAFGVLQYDSNCDILCTLSKNQRQIFRKMVIDMVLATDMSKHMTLLADLKTTVETKRASGSGFINLDNYNTRILILQNLIHAADLSNTTKELSIYLKWVDRITAEFYRQGDEERIRGLEMSAMCDRDTACVPTSQVSFMDFISYPLWETWCDLVYPDGQIMLNGISRNREWFSKESEKSPENGNDAPVNSDVEE